MYIIFDYSAQQHQSREVISFDIYEKKIRKESLRFLDRRHTNSLDTTQRKSSRKL